MYELREALIAFINERPHGNMLREIAERALVDFTSMHSDKFTVPQQNEFIVPPRKGLEIPKHTEVDKDIINSNCRLNLRHIRKSNGLLQRQLAKKLKIPLDRIVMYENGHERIPLSFVVKFCLMFGLEMEYFTTTILYEEKRNDTRRMVQRV